jgi:hypothetical protein
MPHLTLASRSPAVRDVKSSHDVSSEFPKIAPSPSWEPRSPLPRTRSRARFGDRLPTESRVPPSWFSTTLTACSSSALSGCCTGVPVLGFVTFRAVRLCLSRHGFLPFEALLSVHSRLTRGWRTILAPGRRHLRVTPQFTAGLASSSLVALDLEAFLRVRSRIPQGVATVAGPLLPWACPGLLSQALLRVPRHLCSRSGVGLTSSRWVGTSGPDERQRSPTGQLVSR